MNEEFDCLKTKIETVLVLLAVISLPCMLLIKPFVLRSRHNRSRLNAMVRSFSLQKKRRKIEIFRKLSKTVLFDI